MPAPENYLQSRGGYLPLAPFGNPLYVQCSALKPTIDANKLPCQPESVDNIDSLSGRISYVRRKADLTLEEFGRLCRVSKSYVSRLENGTRNPSDSFLDMCSSMLGVDHAWLQTGVGQRPDISVQNNPGFPDELKEGPIVIKGFNPEKYGALDDPVHEEELARIRQAAHFVLGKKDIMNLAKHLLDALTKEGSPFRTRLIWAVAIVEEMLKELENAPMAGERLQIRQKEIRKHGKGVEWLLAVMNNGSRPVDLIMVLEFSNARRVVKTVLQPVELLPGGGNILKGRIDKHAESLKVKWLIPAVEWHTPSASP